MIFLLKFFFISPQLFKNSEYFPLEIKSENKIKEIFIIKPHDIYIFFLINTYYERENNIKEDYKKKKKLILKPIKSRKQIFHNIQKISILTT